MIRKLLIYPEEVKNDKNVRIPYITVNGELVYQAKVDMASVPPGAEREDAIKCGFLSISPYWDEAYDLVPDNNGVIHYVSRQR